MFLIIIDNKLKIKDFKHLLITYKLENTNPNLNFTKCSGKNVALEYDIKNVYCHSKK